MSFRAFAVFLVLSLIAPAALSADPVKKQKDFDKNEHVKNFLLAYWRKQAAEGKAFDYPLLMWANFRGGEVGMFNGDGSIPGAQKNTGTHTILIVQQSLSDSEALLMMRLLPVYERKSETLYLFRGFDFSRYTDDQQFKEKHGAVVTETHRYTTVTGGTNTVFVVEKANFPPIPEHPAFIGVGSRIWNNATGQLSVTGAFYKLENGNVHLVKEDKSVITVPLSRFNHEDQQHIQLLAGEQKERGWQDRWKNDKHTWKDKPGKFSVEAVYDGYVGDGKIRLLRIDHTEIVIRISQLSEPDRRKANALRFAKEK